MDRWTKEQVWRFIDLVEQRVDLYDNRHVDYKNRTKKNAALCDIAEKMSKIKPNITAKDVESKLKCLRDTYIKEKRKVQNGEIYEPKWVFYKRLHFFNVRLEPQTTDLTKTSSSRSSPVPVNSAEAADMMIIPDVEYEETSRDFSQTSETPDRLSRLSQNCNEVMAVANRALEAITQKKVSTGRDTEFCTVLERQMAHIQDEDILERVMQELLASVITGKQDQRTRNFARQRRQGATGAQSHRAEIYITSSPTPSFGPHTFGSQSESPVSSHTYSRRRTMTASSREQGK